MSHSHVTWSHYNPTHFFIGSNSIGLATGLHILGWIKNFSAKKLLRTALLSAALPDSCLPSAGLLAIMNMVRGLSKHLKTGHWAKSRLLAKTSSCLQAEYG